MFRSILAGLAVTVPIFAQTPAAAPAGGGAMGGLGGMLPMMLIMFAVIYFLMIRPEQKKSKNRKKMIDQLKKGDQILTIGGVIAIVGSVKTDTLTVKTADTTILEIRKGAVAEVLTQTASTDDAEAKTDKK